MLTHDNDTLKESEMVKRIQIETAVLDSQKFISKYWERFVFAFHFRHSLLMQFQFHICMNQVALGVQRKDFPS